MCATSARDTKLRAHRFKVRRARPGSCTRHRGIHAERPEKFSDTLIELSNLRYDEKAGNLERGLLRSRTAMPFKTRTCVTLLVFLVLFSSLWFGPRPVRATQNGLLPAKVAVNPSSIASLALQPSSSVTFELNITGSPPFAGFIVAIFYNSSVLQRPQVDYTGTVLGNDAILSSECIDGTGSQCIPDIFFDGIGVVSLALFTASGLNVTTPNGKLFSVTFTVASRGFSAIHFVHQFVGTSPFFSPLQVVTYDGYFANMDCPSGSGNLCKPPIVSFTSPETIVAGQPAVFSAPTSRSQNPDGRITQYNWTWGIGPATMFYNSPPPGSVTPSSNVTIVYPAVGEYRMTLSVADNYGARAYYAATIQVVRVRSVVVSEFFTDSSMNPLPSDINGNSMVTTVLSRGFVRSTNPGQVLAWVNVTNVGSTPLRSLKVNDTLPIDWMVNPPWLPWKSAIHVYYADTTNLATNPEITDPSTVAVSTGNPEVIHLAIPSLNATGIGHPLMPGHSILLSVKLSYNLKMTNQSPASYPRNYTDTASATAWTQQSYTGIESSGASLAFCLAYARVVGDPGNESPLIAIGKYAIT